MLLQYTILELSYLLNLLHAKSFYRIVHYQSSGQIIDFNIFNIQVVGPIDFRMTDIKLYVILQIRAQIPVVLQVEEGIFPFDSIIGAKNWQFLSSHLEDK